MRTHAELDQAIIVKHGQVQHARELCESLTRELEALVAERFPSSEPKGDADGPREGD